MSLNKDTYVLYRPYSPPSSLGRELGIMFGFLGATMCLVVLYWVIWKFLQDVSAKEDAVHHAQLRARGFHDSMLETYFEKRFGHSSWSTMSPAPSWEPTALQRARLSDSCYPPGSNRGSLLPAEPQPYILQQNGHCIANNYHPWRSGSRLGSVGGSDSSSSYSWMTAHRPVSSSVISGFSDANTLVYSSSASSLLLVQRGSFDDRESSYYSNLTYASMRSTDLSIFTRQLPSLSTSPRT